MRDGGRSEKWGERWRNECQEVLPPISLEFPRRFPRRRRGRLCFPLNCSWLLYVTPMGCDTDGSRGLRCSRSVWAMEVVMVQPWEEGSREAECILGGYGARLSPSHELRPCLFDKERDVGWLLGCRTIHPVYCQPHVENGPCRNPAICQSWLSQPRVKRCMDPASSAEPRCSVQVGRAGSEGSRPMKDEGTCQQVLHPAVLGTWRASQSFLAFGSEVGKASWLRRVLESLCQSASWGPVCCLGSDGAGWLSPNCSLGDPRGGSGL